MTPETERGGRGEAGADTGAASPEPEPWGSYAHMEELAHEPAAAEELSRY